MSSSTLTPESNYDTKDQPSETFTPNRQMADRYLTLLDEEAEQFTFQTFDDNKLRKNGALAHILHGTLDEHMDTLAELNAQGAGIFVTVNETDLEGRKGENITRVRAIWQDADRGDEPPLPLEPHITVESSPGKHHRYFLVEGAPIEEFDAVEQRLAKDYGADPNATDLPRVLRLPGFLHMKNPAKPHMVRIVGESGEPPMAWEKVKEIFPPVERVRDPANVALPEPGTPLENSAEVASALAALDPDLPYGDWLQVAMALHSTGAGHEAFELWDQWSQKGSLYKAGECAYRWSTFTQTGGLTLGTLFHMARKRGWKPLREDADRLTALCLDARTRGLEWEERLYEANPKAQTLDAVLTALSNSDGFGGKRALSNDYKAYREARRPGEHGTDAGKASQDEFLAYLPEHRYIYRPTGELWPTQSIDSALWPGASKHLDQNAAIQQMTWAPGMPEVIEDRLVVDGGWIDAPGKRTYNLYKPPLPFQGDAGEAGPWVEHVRRVYPEDAEHIMDWLAQRVQSPEVKLNHALVLGGSQGIGKDTLLEPAIHGVGPWNTAEIAPTQLLGSFNGWVNSVILRVSEARDLGEITRFAFYDHTKTYIAAPPEVLRVNEKNRREYPVFNKTGVIITTNHKLDGLYLPSEDRRHYVAWSEATKEEFPEAYWKTLWDWYNDGGVGHVIAFLKARDLSQFDPKAPPKQTEAFKAIVATNHPTEDLALADLLEEIGSPTLVVTSELASEARTRHQFELSNSLEGPKNARKLPHRMERAGYELYANPDTNDGRWKVNNKNERLFARRGTTGEERELALLQRRERVYSSEIGRPPRERPGLQKAA